MKIKEIIALLGLFVFLENGHVCAQTLSIVPYTHTHVVNTDKGAVGKLTTVSTVTGGRLLANQSIERTLEQAVDHQTATLALKYDKNAYDEKSSFITQTAAKMAMALGQKIMATEFSKGYYMTKNKRDFMDQIGLDKLMLLTLQNIDYANITTDSRQEIYRLRREILKEYSKNDRAVLALLLLPAVRYSVETAPELAQIIKAMDFIE